MYEPIRMTNAYKADKLKTWKGWLGTLILICGLSIANVYGTHQAIKHEKEVKQYLDTKTEQVVKGVKFHTNIIKQCLEDYF